MRLNNITGTIYLSLFAIFLFAVVWLCPENLSDKNLMMRVYFNKVFLFAFLAYSVMSVVLASGIISNLNMIEFQHKTTGAFKNTRRNLKRGLMTILFLTPISFFLIAEKEKILTNQLGEAIINGLSLFILFWVLLVVTSFANLALAISDADIN